MVDRRTEMKQEKDTAHMEDGTVEVPVVTH